MLLIRRSKCWVGSGISPDDVALLRLDTIGAEDAHGEPLALVYADLLGQARVNARRAGRYLVFMVAAGVIAAFGVINEDQVLIVGAMAVAPDLLPITAACTGLVLRRARLIRRALFTVFVGLGVAGLAAAVVSGSLDLLGLLPPHFALTETGIASQQHINAGRSALHSPQALRGCSRSRPAQARRWVWPSP